MGLFLLKLYYSKVKLARCLHLHSLLIFCCTEVGHFPCIKYSGIFSRQHKSEECFFCSILFTGNHLASCSCLEMSVFSLTTVSQHIQHVIKGGGGAFIAKANSPALNAQLLHTIGLVVTCTVLHRRICRPILKSKSCLAT